MKILVTDFAERHFDPKFGGTKILNFTKEEFDKEIDRYHEDILYCIENANRGEVIEIGNDAIGCSEVVVHDGYAPFCKLVAIKNFTDARVGSMPITLENYQYLRSGYSSRTKDELPIFSRWLELPLGKPVAEWLMLVLYDKEQIDQEAKVKYDDFFKNKKGFIRTQPLPPKPFEGEWGIVAILGQSHPKEEPMKPETMIRNAGYNTEEFQEEAIDQISEIPIMIPDDEYAEKIKEIFKLQGKMVGGSGVPLDKEKYLKSVEFWDKNATVK